MKFNRRLQILGLAAIAMCSGYFLGASSAQAQLNVFEQPRNRPPSNRRGFSFGAIRLGGQSGQKLYVQGVKLYKRGNYAGASLKFYRIVKHISGSRWHSTAEFRLAAALYRMRLLRSSQHFFSNIIQSGANHPHYKAAIVYLMQISRHTKDLSFLGKLRRFRPSDIPKRHRDELLYLLGRYYFQNRRISFERRLSAALKVLQRVSRRNPLFYARAQYVMGAIYIAAARPGTPEVGRYRNQAAASFRLCGRWAMRIKNKKLRQNIVELAILGLARVHYEAKHFSGAIHYYQNIARNSPRWLDSVFEMAWSYLKIGKYSHTLGLIHTLDSPYFRNEYFPEAGILRAISYFERCRYKKVKALVKKYLRRYRPLSQNLRSFLRRYPTNRKLFGALLNLKDRESAAGLDDDASEQMLQRIFKTTSRNKALRRMFSAVRRFDREMGLMREQGVVWRRSSLSSYLQNLLTRKRLQKVKQAGGYARHLFKLVVKELQMNISLALKIRYETLGAEKNILQDSVRKQGGFQMRQDSRRRKRNLISVSLPGEFVYWPFQGEYWIDELGYYRYRIKGECRKR